MASDIIMLTNGPGELLTWVCPVFDELRNSDRDYRFSLVLLPCLFAGGKEATIAKERLGIDRIIKAKQIYKFLLHPHSFVDEEWYSSGVVIGLGGDPFFSWMVAKRLKFKLLVYSERPFWLSFLADSVAIQNPSRRSLKRATKVGPLLLSAIDKSPGTKKSPWPEEPNNKPVKKIALLPGSKPIKLKLLIPCALVVADILKQKVENYSLCMFMAPGTSISDLKYYASSENSFFAHLNLTKPSIQKNADNEYFLLTSNRAPISLCFDFPAYASLQKADLALTAVGTITDELGFLNVPMLVMTPCQAYNYGLKSERYPIPGLIGLMVRIPIIGKFLTSLLYFAITAFSKPMAWPNIRLNKEVVPEIWEGLSPAETADKLIQLLYDEHRLKEMKRELLNLKAVPNPAGEIRRLVDGLLFP